MSARRLASMLGTAGFLVALLATMPLRWITPLLPGSIECAAPAGTIWHGRCAALRIGSAAVGGTTWQWRAPELARLRLSVDLAVVQPGLELSSRLTVLPTGRVVARDLSAALELGYALVERLAPNLRGSVSVQAEEVVLADGWVRDLRGEIRVSGLEQTYPLALALGSYRIVFADPATADGRLVGRLTDVGGPLDVQGLLTLLPERAYELSGTVAVRPEASPLLANQIRFLGSPDATGRRAFAQSETF